MHLIDALCAGIRGAEGGTASLLLRGTASYANYYPDFEASQLLDGTSIELDSNGSVVAYVASLVDVKVYDSLGTLVREFVAGSEDAAIEVISPSFTGTDYTSGASGVQKPTTLERVLDAWVTSAGATNWQVLFNGVATNLQAAFSTTFFNVKNYGAVGNGVADDTSAITTGQAAAAAAGGVLFFPPGTYRITSAITLAAKVTWLGSGGSASKVAIDSAVGSGAIVLGANGVGVQSGMTGMWIGAINGASPGTLISGSAVSTGEVHFTDCVIGNDGVCINPCYVALATTASFKTVFTRCYIKMSAATGSIVSVTGLGRTTFRDCDLIQGNGVSSGTLVQCDDWCTFEGNRFDWSAAAAGANIQYLRINPTSQHSVIVIGNSFARNAAVASTAIYNALATPSFDAIEYGNTFGDNAGSVTAYDYASLGYSSFSSLGTTGHGSRLVRVEGLAAFTSATFTARPDVFSSTSIERTAGAALTVSASGAHGRMGDRWTLHITNATGGVLTVTLGTNIIGDGVAFTINNGGFGNAEFVYLPQPGGGVGSGRWYQVAPAVKT